MIQKFVDAAAANKEAHQEEYEKWINSHTPLEIKQANLARRRLAQIQNKKFFPIHDPRLVKRAKVGYLFYAEERHQAGDLKHMTIPERGVRIAEEWRGMTDAEKQVCILKPWTRSGTHIANRNTCVYKKPILNGTSVNTRKSMARMPPTPRDARLNERCNMSAKQRSWAFVSLPGRLMLFQDELWAGSSGNGIYCKLGLSCLPAMFHRLLYPPRDLISTREVYPMKKSLLSSMLTAIARRGGWLNKEPRSCDMVTYPNHVRGCDLSPSSSDLQSRRSRREVFLVDQTSLMSLSDGYLPGHTADCSCAA